MNTDSYTIGFQQPMVITDRFNQIHDFAFVGDARSISKTNEFFAVVGKRVLCKAQGLSGAERALCTAQILAKCGRKPHAIAVTKKQKSDNAKWETCGQGVTYNPVGDLADTTAGKDGSVDAGAGTVGSGSGTGGDGTGTSDGTGGLKTGTIDWTKIAIYSGLGILLVGGTVALVKHSKKVHAMKTANIVR